MSQNVQDFSAPDREFSRVDTCLALRMQPCSRRREDNDPFQNLGHALGVTGPMPEPEDEVLTLWLKAINSKLDAVMNYILFQTEGLLSLKMRPVNISASGMSFMSDQKYEVGDIIEIKMMLHVFHPVALYLYGESGEGRRCRQDGKFDHGRPGLLKLTMTLPIRLSDMYSR